MGIFSAITDAVGGLRAGSAQAGQSGLMTLVLLGGVVIVAIVWLAVATKKG